MSALSRLLARHHTTTQRRRSITRRLAAHRRLIAAVLAGAAMACALASIGPPGGVEVLAAAHDLGGGRLSASDVMVVRLPPDAVPDGVFRPGATLTGRVVAGPMRRGEPLTDARILGRGMLSTQGPGMVATPVRIADPAAGELLSPGDVVDVLAAFETDPFAAGPLGADPLAGAPPEEPAGSAAADDTGGFERASSEGAARQAVMVAREVRVMTPPSSGEGGEGVLLVLATTPGQAARLAQAQAHGRLSVAIHPR
ncbi:SAF domain-containing protein [Sphaerimonospora mesophila]|uniref:SAF domain-containing protein n=1 Tax=Sphaerimonospora mesophila TaxID=37483 RepID=UPI0006E154BA